MSNGEQKLEAGNTTTFCLFRKLISRPSSLHCFSTVGCPGCKLPQLWHAAALWVSWPCLRRSWSCREQGVWGTAAWGSSCAPEQLHKHSQVLTRPPAADHLSAEQPCTLWVKNLCLWRLWVLHTQIMTEFQAQSSAEVTSPKLCQPKLWGLCCRWSSSWEQGWKSCFHFELDNLTDSFNTGLGSAIFILNHNLLIFPKWDALVVVVLVTKNKRNKNTALYTTPREGTENLLLILQTPQKLFSLTMLPGYILGQKY